MTDLIAALDILHLCRHAKRRIDELASVTPELPLGARGLDALIAHHEVMAQALCDERPFVTLANELGVMIDDEFPTTLDDATAEGIREAAAEHLRAAQARIFHRNLAWPFVIGPRPGTRLAIAAGAPEVVAQSADLRLVELLTGALVD